MIPATTNYQNALAAFQSGFLVTRVEIAGYSKVFMNYDDGVNKPWLSGVDDIAIQVDDLAGGANQVSTAFYVQDVGGAVTADFPGFTFEGKQVTIKTGFAGLASADFMTMFTGYIDSVASFNGNTEYQFNCSDISAKLSQVVYLTGDDGQPTSAEHKKTLTMHPLDILLDILNVQIGLSPSFVDSAKIQAYRDGPFAGVTFLFRLDQAPAADEFIKTHLLKPLGGYVWVNSLGQVTVNFNYPLTAPVALTTLGPDTWMTVPTAEQSDMVNVVQTKFDKDDGSGQGSSGNFLAVDTELYGPSVSLYGQYGEQVVEADGLRSAFQGFFVAKLASRLTFLRYGMKNLKFDSDAAPGLWSLARFEPGDLVQVTHPQIPNRAAGTVGVTNYIFEVLNKTMGMADGVVTLTMVDANYLKTFGFFLIAPDGEADYAAASTGDKHLYMFMCSDADKYSNNDPFNALG